ncbi:MAG: L-glyceraldehyde 3-phosphate reductase [Oceanospirillaceae bacterium]
MQYLITNQSFKGNIMSYTASENRYQEMQYNRCGDSGLKLPAVSLGMWHNFGEDVVRQTSIDIVRRAFDLGVTHFDLANNYGPPAGAAENFMGEMLRKDFASYRDEMIISSKAGYDMWPGPYGEWGSRKYLIASLDQSLQRMGLDYVDIFYSHRFDPNTPLEETMGALDSIVKQGKALYVGLSSYNSQRTKEAVAILKDLGTPCLIHQPSYSMLNRWVEDDGLLDTLDDLAIGSIAFSPLAQGLLSNKYLKGVSAGSRASQGKSLGEDQLSDENIQRIKALNDIAEQRGQTLAQMAIAWVLRKGRVTSALVGASSVAQLENSIGALANLQFSDTELSLIDNYAQDSGINLWALSSQG